MILICNASNMAFSPKFDKDEKIFLNWSKSFEIFSETSIERSLFSFETFSFWLSLLFIDRETAFLTDSSACCVSSILLSYSVVKPTSIFYFLGSSSTTVVVV